MKKYLCVITTFLCIFLCTPVHAEDFTIWPSPSDTLPVKIWAVKFNQQFQPETTKNIYILNDNTGDVLKDVIVYPNSNGRMVYVYPKEGYPMAGKYTLIIKDVISTSGKTIKPVKMEFNIVQQGTDN